MPDLGAPNYKELYERFGFDLDELADQCRELLDVDRAAVRGRRRPALPRPRRRLARRGASAGTSRASSARREWDSAFPADAMLPALEGTLSDLGIDLRSQPNVELDIEQREKKTPRAFCAPIEVPGRVVLVIQPIGGADDWRALFHEAGHTEHFANTSPDLPMEDKRLGDNAVTEGWAMLLQHLTDEPRWLQRRLDMPRPGRVRDRGRDRPPLLRAPLRAKLLYEIEFHTADDPTAMRPRYVELLADALKIAPSPTDYLADIDGGFYVTEYLRSWAFEAQLRDYLRQKFGNDWFAGREAGGLLRELWSLGQRLQRRRAARGRHRREARDGLGRRPHPRGAALERQPLGTAEPLGESGCTVLA